MQDSSNGVVSAESTRRRPGYDQATILGIAVDVFNQRGYDATSVGTLATRLRISKSAIYHHFPSKGALLAMALDEALGSLEVVLKSIEEFSGDPREQLEYAIRGAIKVVCDKLPYVTLLLRVRGNTEVERGALARRRDFDRRLSRVIQKASEQGVLRGDLDPGITSRLIFGTINSLVEWYRPGGSQTAEMVADDLIALLFDGLRGPVRHAA
ncbi:TetR/AcrR family transcriptional regulator [bacterium RCC_150]